MRVRSVDFNYVRNIIQALQMDWYQTEVWKQLAAAIGPSEDACPIGTGGQDARLSQGFFLRDGRRLSLAVLGSIRG